MLDKAAVSYRIVLTKRTMVRPPTSPPSPRRPRRMRASVPAAHPDNHRHLQRGRHGHRRTARGGAGGGERLIPRPGRSAGCRHPVQAARPLAMKLIIGNKAYSSWSLRALARLQTVGPAVRGGVSCRSMTRNGTGVAKATSSPLRPARCRSCGAATIRWCGTAWRSSIYLADRVGRARIWPEDDSARAMARSMAARCTPAKPESAAPAHR